MPCRSYTQRIVHPYFTVVQPQKATEEEMGFWPLFLSFADDRKQEKSKEFPTKEKKLTNKTCGATSIRKIIRSAIDPVHTIVEISKGQFCISVPVGKDFKPENLNVKIKDRVAIVEMKIEQTSEDGTSQLSQMFTKKITLPEEAKLEEVQSRLTPEGVLKIEVPLPVPEQPSKPQAVEIPVTMEVEDSSLSNQS